MKIEKKHLAIIAAVIVFVCIIIFAGGSNERAIKKVVTAELDQLKNMDSETVSSYLSYETLFPESEETGKISDEIKEIFPLFFEDFSYSIKDISIDKNEAAVDVRIKVIDAATLAKDYMKAAMQKRIASSANPSAVEYSLEDYYLLLRDLLLENKYDMVKEDCQLSLEKEQGEWKVKHTKTSDNQLTGNFVSHLSNSNLFTPEEIIEIHFDTIKGFDLEQLNRYLQLDTLFDMDDTDQRTMTQAVAAQIHEHFDYKILDSETDGQTVTVSLEITSWDSKSVLTNYETALASYLTTSQALEDGTSGRLAVANQLLLENIEANTASATTPITLELTNDGSSWKLQMTDEVAQAILGNIGTALSEISTEVPDDAALEATSDVSEETTSDTSEEAADTAEE